MRTFPQIRRMELEIQTTNENDQPRMTDLVKEHSMSLTFFSLRE